MAAGQWGSANGQRAYLFRQKVARDALHMKGEAVHAGGNI